MMTLLVLLILALCVWLAIRTLKRSGGSSCNCCQGCSNPHCPSRLNNLSGEDVK